MAIICVLLDHFFGFHPLGSAGVTAFFVLSGLLMSGILFIDKTPLSTFYRRRIARIFPVFWLYIAVVFFGGWITRQTFNANEFIACALFLRTYFPTSSIFKAELPIHHLWSLNVEEHSYILLSLMAVVAARFGEKLLRNVLVAGAATAVLLFVFYKHFPPASESPFILRSEVAAFPLLLSASILMWNRLKGSMNAHPAVSPISLVLAFAATLLVSSVFLGFVLASLFFAVSINTLSTSSKWMRIALEMRLLRWLGVCSYSIYIWQQPFYFLRGYWSFPYSNIAGVTLTMIVAVSSFYFFERPLRAFLSGRSRVDRAS
jgi:peptidoglycan/LPS O-acetylase OafA/YrhL